MASLTEAERADLRRRAGDRGGSVSSTEIGRQRSLARREQRSGHRSGRGGRVTRRWKPPSDQPPTNRTRRAGATVCHRAGLCPLDLSVTDPRITQPCADDLPRRPTPSLGDPEWRVRSLVNESGRPREATLRGGNSRNELLARCEITLRLRGGPCSGPVVATLAAARAGATWRSGRITGLEHKRGTASAAAPRAAVVIRTLGRT